MTASVLFIRKIPIFVEIVAVLKMIFFFIIKRNNIHSFKLIEYIDMMNIAKSKKGEPVNKLTTSMLIA